MKILSTLETQAKDALAKALDCDPELARRFRSIIYRHAGRVAPNPTAAWELQREYPIRTGFIEILLSFKRHALVIEAKVCDKEKLHQYQQYPRLIRENRFDVCCVGLLAKKGARRGRQLLLEEFLTQAADARILWGNVVMELNESAGSRPAFKELYHTLKTIDPALVTPAHDSYVTSASPPSLDLHNLAHEPKKFAHFCLDFVRALGAEFSAEPSQGGNSPIGIAFGKQSWADWFGDGFANRVKLVFETPRPSKPDIETHFCFTAILWNKGSSGGIFNRNRVEAASRHFAARGYNVFRNEPSKHHRGQPSTQPVPTTCAGLFYVNAFDSPRFRLPVGDAISLGWKRTLLDLSTEARRVIRAMDELTAAVAAK